MSLLFNGTNVNARRLEWRMAHIPSTWWQPMVLAPLLCMRGNSRITVHTRPNRCRTYSLGSRHSPSSYMAGLNPRTRVTRPCLKTSCRISVVFCPNGHGGLVSDGMGRGPTHPSARVSCDALAACWSGPWCPFYSFVSWGMQPQWSMCEHRALSQGLGWCCCLFSVCFGLGRPLTPALLLMMTLLFWGLPTHMGCVVQLLSVARLWRGTGCRCRNR